jgi:DNA-binding SARP family transcriptional activator
MTIRRIAALVQMTAAAAGLVALVVNRPDLPSIPALDQPLASETIQAVARAALWGALVVLLAVTLAHGIAIATHRAARPLPLPRGQSILPGIGAAVASDRAAPSLKLRRPHQHDAPVLIPPASSTSQAASPGVQLRLFGPPRLVGAPQPQRTVTTELLAYLALHGPATRDELLEALWPDEDPERTKARLWQSITEAKRLLPHLMGRANGRYALDTRRVKVDLDAARRLLSTAERAGDAHAARDALEQAIDLTDGEPLQGCGYRWADGDVREASSLRLTLLRRLATALVDAGEPSEAIRLADRGLRIDELDEDLWRLAMRAEADLGLRDHVVRRYNALHELLVDRLGLQPQRETVDLYRRALGQR